MDRKSHWDRIYGTKRADEVSWFQPRAELSLALICDAVGDRDAPILDVGGGASTLAGDLLAQGYRRITVLDIAGTGLAQAEARLGPAARRIGWVVGDVLAAPIAAESVALWHDRAVFHFLTDLSERARYIAEVRRVVRPGGFVLVATFAEDGPDRCSGLPVARYSAEGLHATFDGEFELLTSHRQVHHTPAGVAQAFTYCLCRYVPDASAQAAA